MPGATSSVELEAQDLIAADVGHGYVSRLGTGFAVEVENDSISTYRRFHT